MSISDNYTPIKALGNGVTTTFSGSWKMISEDYSRVWLESVATGVQTLKVLDTDYTVAISDSGFVVTMAAAPTNANYVVIGREVPKDQLDPYKTSKGFQGSVLEGGLDKLSAITQDLQDQVDRTLKLKVGTAISGIELGDPVANKALIWDAAGENIIASTDDFGDAAARAEAAAALAEGYADALVNGTSFRYMGVAGGTENAITLTNTVPIASYVVGMGIAFRATLPNTGATVINIDGVGSASIITNRGSSLAGYEMVANGYYLLVYNGTSFKLLNTSALETGDIQSSAVTYEKIQNVSATDKILGRSSAGAGVVQEITCTQAGRDLLDDANAAAQRTTLSLGTASTLNTGTASGAIPLLGTGNAQVVASYSIVNNGVQTLAMPSTDTVVMAIVGCSSSTHGIFIARIGQTPFVSGTTNFAGTTGVLNGSTGTAGKLTLSTSGTTLYIENRQGFTYVVSILLSHNNV